MAIRERLSGTARADVTLTTSAATAVGDYLVVFHSWNWRDIANMVSPTGTSGTWTLQAQSVASGTNNPLQKVWTRQVTVAGAQTITCSVNGATDADNFVIAYVISDIASVVGAAGSNNTTDATDHPIPSVTTGSPAAGDLFLGSHLSGYQAGVINYTIPGTMSNKVEVDGAFSQSTSVSAEETLASAGATGTRSFTASAAAKRGSTSIVLRPTSASTTIRFYLNNAAGAFTPTVRGTWDVTTQTGTSLMDRNKSGASSTVAQAVGATTLPRDVLLRRFMSPPMVTAGTLSGTFNWVMGVLESATGLDGYFKVHVYVTVGSTDVVRGTAVTNMSFGPSTANGNIVGTEWSTGHTGRGEGTESLSNVSCQVGDRIVVEVGYRADGAGSTTQTATLRYGGTGADLAQGGTATTDVGWVEFSGAKNLFINPDAITYVGAGTDSLVSGATSNTPGLPSGLLAGDLMVLQYAGVSWSKTPNAPGAPSGWTVKDSNVSSSGESRLTWMYRYYQAGDSAPTLTYSGSANDTHFAQIFAFRQALASGDPTDVLGTATSNANLTDVGPITGVTTTTENGIVLVGAVREQDWASIATLSGDSLTWVEVCDRADFALLDNIGVVLDYALTSGATTVTNKTFTVTAGNTGPAVGQMWALRSIGDEPPPSPSPSPGHRFLSFFPVRQGWHPAPSFTLGQRTLDLSTQGTVRTANSVATIQSQISASSAGDTVEIAAGTYGAIVTSKNIASGTIRIVPASGATVTVDGVNLTNAAGLDWRGINSTGEIFYSATARCSWRGGLLTMTSTEIGHNIRASCSDLTIEDCTITDADSSFNLFAATDATASNNITIQHCRSENVVQDHVFFGRSTNVLISANEFVGHTDTTEHSDGVQIVGGKNVTIRGNHMWNTRTFRDTATDRNDHGIMINYTATETDGSGGPGRVPEDIIIESNLIHDQASTGISVAGCLGVTIRNNTIYDNGSGGTAAALITDPDTSNTVDDVHVVNNIVNAWTNSGATIVTNTHNFVADGSGPAGTSLLTGSPGFVDSSVQNYELTGGSQNVLSGTSTGAAVVDLYNVTRPSPPSRGAIE